MIFFDYQVLLAATVMVLMVLAPIYAWPETRKLTLPVFGFYVLFLWLNSEFVFGELGTGHDVIWNWHSWSVIVQQWLQSGVSLGWNPYWGAGQPFALYNNIFCYLPTIAFSHFFNLLGLSLPATTFFNIIYLFGYFNICTGSLLLFRLLYQNNYICLFGFITMLFGGLFYADIYESSFYTLCFFPYFLFLLIYFYRTRSPGSLVFFCLILGLSVNFYLPTYNYIALLIFLFISLIAGLARRQRLKEGSAACLQAMVSNPRLILLALALFLCTAAPLIANYIELQDYVSPTRGYSTDMKPTQLSFQETVGTPLNHYTYLFDYETAKTYDPAESFLVKSHGGFYVGILSSLGILVALFLGRIWVFIIFSGALAVLGAGHQTPAWEWLRDYIPLAGIMRHSFPFAKLAGFAIVTASLSGLTALISETISSTRKFIAIPVAASILYFLFPGELSNLQIANLTLGFIVLVAISIPWSTIQPRALMVCLPLLLAVQYTDLFLFSAHQEYYKGRQIKMTEIIYPEKWESLSKNLKGMPYDHTPLFDKKAVWANRTPDFIFMLQKDFAQFLLHNNLVPIRNLQSLETPTLSTGLALREIKGNIFHILPFREGLPPDQISVQALKVIAGIHKPMLRVEGGTSDQASLSAILDHDVRTFWKMEPGQNTWVSFSVQEGFNSNRLEIWYEPSFRTEVQDEAELWVSNDPQTWEFAQKLKRELSPPDKAQGPTRYILDSTISKNYFKLVFNGEHPESVAEVALVEPTTTTSPENLINAGVIHQRKSKSSNRVELDVSAESDAYILRLENYHPDWLAFIDGEEVPILRVYPNFQMVFVPAGEHKLTFEFQSIYYSLVILNIVIGFLGGAAFLFWLANLSFTGIRTRFNLQKLFPSREPAGK